MRVSTSFTTMDITTVHAVCFVFFCPCLSLKEFQMLELHTWVKGKRLNNGRLGGLGVWLNYVPLELGVHDQGQNILQSLHDTVPALWPL